MVADALCAAGSRTDLAAPAGRTVVLAPGSKVAGRWKRNADFFRKGRRGEWREVFSPETQALYVAETRNRYDHHLLYWLENGRAAAGDPRTL